jgi:[acyl-carrier-protein] S-malonyltransferase
MKNATIEMLDKIKSIEFKTPTVKVYSNVSATFSKNSNEIKKLLLEQIESPVRWREIIENMSKNGVNNFIEIGPGKVLSGLVKRIDRNNIVNQVNNLEDIKRLNLK